MTGTSAKDRYNMSLLLGQRRPTRDPYTSEPLVEIPCECPGKNHGPHWVPPRLLETRK